MYSFGRICLCSCYPLQPRLGRPKPRAPNKQVDNRGARGGQGVDSGVFVSKNMVRDQSLNKESNYNGVVRLFLSYPLFYK